MLRLIRLTPRKKKTIAATVQSYGVGHSYVDNKDKHVIHVTLGRLQNDEGNETFCLEMSPDNARHLISQLQTCLSQFHNNYGE